MATVADRVDVAPERAWGATVLALLAVLIGGSVLAPRVVYEGFVWHYFWGPVQADANSATCAVIRGGEVVYLRSSGACAAAAEPVAYPGYTLVSEVGYIVTLLLALVGVVFLMRRLGIGHDRDLFFALVPFVLFGGVFRVVEDASDAFSPAEAFVSYPWNVLLISPIIYFTVFGITLAAVVGGTALARRDVADDYHRVVAGVGTAVLTLTLGYLVWLSATTDAVQLYPQVFVVMLGGATLVAGATWWLIERFAPEINAGTGMIGLVVIWGHAVDGTANVVGLDWMVALGAPQNLVPKHPVNRAIVEFTGATLPESVLAVTGDAWPFLVVKLAAATFVVWVFEPEMFEESPRYTVLLLVAVLAVGLGPGTRDMVRATFGV